MRDRWLWMQARSRKAFDIRLENLQKSKAEKEESHKKLQDKYLKEMAEFEKKVRAEPDSRQMGLCWAAWRAVGTRINLSASSERGVG